MLATIVLEIILGMMLLFGGLHAFRAKLHPIADVVAVLILGIGLFFIIGAVSNIAIHYPWVFMKQP